MAGACRRASAVTSCWRTGASSSGGSGDWSGWFTSESLPEALAAFLQVGLFFRGVVAPKQLVTMRKSPKLTDDLPMLLSRLQRALERRFQLNRALRDKPSVR